MPRTILLFTVFLLASLAALHAAEPLTIVAFGDSTTAERGSTRVYASLLTGQLQQRGGGDVRVVNAGVGGNTTPVARKRLEKDVLAHQPALVMIQFGINDAAVDVWKTPPATVPRTDLKTFEADLRFFVAECRRTGAMVLLLTPNPLQWADVTRKLYGKPPYNVEDSDGFNVVLKEYAQAVRRISAEEHVLLADVDAAFRGEFARHAGAESSKKDKPSGSWLLPDGMHPGNPGHALIADLIVDALGAESASPVERKPFSKWIRLDEHVQVHPRATDISPDLPHSGVLGVAMVNLDGGGVMHVYSGPNGYGTKTARTFVACRVTHDGGRTWGPEQVITRHDDRNASHPTVMRSADGSLHVFYLGYNTWGWTKDGEPDGCDSPIWTIRSLDGGKTWMDRVKVFEGYSGATNGAIQTETGRLLVPFSHYVSKPGRLQSSVGVSDDGGLTWRTTGFIDIGGAGHHSGALEPSVLELRDGRIWMLIRTERRFFMQSFSADGGLTWSPAEPTPIAAVSAPGHTARLHDGRIVLVYNALENGRQEVELAFSSDEARTWTAPVAVARGKGTTYPFVLEHTPGELWVGFFSVPRGFNQAKAKLMKIATDAVAPTR